MPYSRGIITVPGEKLDDFVAMYEHEVATLSPEDLESSANAPKQSTGAAENKAAMERMRQSVADIVLAVVCPDQTEDNYVLASSILKDRTVPGEVGVAVEAGAQETKADKLGPVLKEVDWDRVAKLQDQKGISDANKLSILVGSRDNMIVLEKPEIWGELINRRFILKRYGDMEDPFAPPQTKTGLPPGTADTYTGKLPKNPQTIKSLFRFFSGSGDVKS